jgi:hypothetical protein
MMTHVSVHLDTGIANRGWTIHRNRNRATSILAA